MLSSKPIAVTMMIGIDFVAGLFLIAQQAVSPSILGIIISIRITSGF